MAKKKQKLTTKNQTPVPVKVVNETASEGPKMPDKWEAENAARTLMEAEEIKANTKLHNAAKASLRKKVSQINKTLKKK